MTTHVMSSFILIVDDETEACGLLQKYLQSRGYTVETAADGREARAMIQRRRPDCVLADVKMPVMGGEELLDWMQKSHLKIPVIMTTAVADIEKAQECRSKGAVHYLVKPLDLEELDHLIHDVL